MYNDMYKFKSELSKPRLQVEINDVKRISA